MLSALDCFWEDPQHSWYPDSSGICPIQDQERQHLSHCWNEHWNKHFVECRECCESAALSWIYAFGKQFWDFKYLLL